MIHVLNLTLNVPAGIDEVFGFMANIGKLEQVTPPDLHFDVLTPHSTQFAKGIELEYRLRAFGFPLSWRSRITQWEPPHMFADEQVSGPYSIWRHTHRFEENAGVTTMTDEIQYELPFSPFSEVFHPLVRKELDRIFLYRSQYMAKVLGKAAS